MNDYRKIRTGDYLYRLRPAHTLARPHRVSRSFIEAELREILQDRAWSSLIILQSRLHKTRGGRESQE